MLVTKHPRPRSGRDRGAWRTAVLLAMTIGFWPSGCEEAAPRRNPKVEAGRIVFMGAAKDDPVWHALVKGAKRYPETLGDFKLDIAAPEMHSVRAQLELLGRLRSPDMRGLCIQPAIEGAAEAVQLRDALSDLRTEGIVVVTMLVVVETPNPFLHAGVDDWMVGRAMADAVAEAVGRKGTIAVLHNQQSTDGGEDRYFGVKERLGEFPGLTVLTEIDCAGNEFSADGLMREYMERFPRLSGWVAIDNWPLRHLRAAERLLPQTCQMVTYGPFPKFWPRLADGTCYAMVGADYESVADNARRMCITVARGEVAPVARYLAPPVTVTVKNLPEFRRTWWESPRRPDGAPSDKDAGAGVP